ncbi:MAG: hypothetical protein ABW278_16310 [Steroidobacteraceae bacterium]
MEESRYILVARLAALQQRAREIAINLRGSCAIIECMNRGASDRLAETADATEALATDLGALWLEADEPNSAASPAGSVFRQGSRINVT